MQLILKKKNMQTSDRTFNIDEGSTITENYNETLDSAVIRVSHISTPIDIEPFDKAVLHDERGRIADRYMCVDTYVETMESLDPLLYTYEINLFSETKELENIALPNLTITQNPDGTRLAIVTYINRMLTLYSPKQRTSTGWRNKYALNSDLFSKFAVDCPEMQWNNPTLREVLTDLMMVVDCIPVLRNNVIDCIDLTEIKDAVDKTKVNYIQRSQSSEDYVSELKMDMQNVMQTQVDSVKQTCTKVEYTTLTTDGFVATNDNCYLKTQFPILKVKHCYMYFQAGVGNYDGNNVLSYHMRMFKIDLCNVNNYRFLYEKTEYDTLAVDRKVSEYLQKSLQYLSQHSNFCVYFTRGDNKIQGFGLTQKLADFIAQTTNVLAIMKDVFPRYCNDIDNVHWSVKGTTTNAGNSYFTTFFEVEYETLTDSVFTASKYLAPTHQRVIIDNQTNSYVDAYNQGFMEYQKVNRLGNHQLHINARFIDDYDLIKIGDYYEDNIVYQTQYQIYNDHIEVNAIATKNYILRDYFTGVKARIRSWKIADGNEALVRHELDKYYLEFSFKQKTENVSLNYHHIANYFLTPIYTGNVWPITKVAVNVDDLRPSSTTYYCLDLIGRIIGNSIVFNFGFDDNFQAGKRVSSEVVANDINSSSSNYDFITYETFRIKDVDWSRSYGGILLEPLRYVDNNGKFGYLTYVFSYVEGYNFPAELSSSQEIQLMLLGCQRPVVNYNEISSGITFWTRKTIVKDNREIIKISTQFELCSDTYDIAFTKKFLELEQCIRNSYDPYSLVDGTPRLQLFLRQGDIFDFNFKNMSIDDTTVIGQNADIDVVSVDEGTAYIDLPNVNFSNHAFYITYLDRNNEEQLLIGWTGHTRVYLNVLLSRDYNIYDNNGNIIGSI